MTVTKSFSVEFDDSLLDYEGWKAPRYEGSKLIAKEINKLTQQSNTGFRSIFIGSNPTHRQISESKAATNLHPNARHNNNYIKGHYTNNNPKPHIKINQDNDIWGGDILGPQKDNFNFVIGRTTNTIPIGTRLLSAEDEDYKLVRIDGHSYLRIDRFLVIDKEFNTTQIINVDDIHSASLMPMIGNICEEGSSVNLRILDKNIETNIKSDGYFVKSNIGEFAKIYGYEPPRTRLANGKYQTSSFFNVKSGDGVVIGHAKNPRETPPLNRFIGSYSARSSKVTHVFNVFCYGQTLTGSSNTASNDTLQYNSPTMFFRSDINGSFNNLNSGSLTDMYSGSFHVPRNKNGIELIIPELRVGSNPWLGSTHFTSVISASGGTSKFSGSKGPLAGEDKTVFTSGFENVRQPRNPLRTFINDKVLPDIISSSNQYFITAESGNFGVPNNKLESICTGELRIPGNGRSLGQTYMTVQEEQGRSAEGADLGPNIGRAKFFATNILNESSNEEGQFDPYEGDIELIVGMTPRGIPSTLSGSDFFMCRNSNTPRTTSKRSWSWRCCSN